MHDKRRIRAAKMIALTEREKAVIDKCVKHYEAKARLFQNAADAVVSACTNDPDLKKFIHFIKHRLKDPEHLRAKLRKRASEAKEDGGKPTINDANLFREIRDLAGVRILHLYTDQTAEMNKRILTILKELNYR